jgi:hypothetical protein
MLEPFDLPVMTPNCEKRASSTVAPQSLLMMNSDLVVSEARAMAARVRREAGADPAAQFQRAWRLAFGRAPTAAENEAGLAFLAGAAAPPPSTAAKPGEPAAVETALAQLCHALVISNEFLYVE